MTHYLAYLQHYWQTRKTPLSVVHGWGTEGNYLHRLVEKCDTLWIIVNRTPLCQPIGDQVKSPSNFAATLKSVDL